jgi:hypothetical protein
MRAARGAGAIIGVLLLLQMLGSAVVNFGLEGPLFGPPGFLRNAPLHTHQVGFAVVIALMLEALWLGIAVTVSPFGFARARALTLCLVSLAAVCVAVAVVENAGVLSMLSLSETYATASAANRPALEAVQVGVASSRNWVHYLARMLDGSAVFVLMAVFYRCALVPRALAACGMVASVMQVVGVGMPLFGRSVIFPLLAPSGFTLLAIAVLLLVKGLGAEPIVVPQPLANIPTAA